MSIGDFTQERQNSVVLLGGEIWLNKIQPHEGMWHMLAWLFDVLWRHVFTSIDVPSETLMWIEMENRINLDIFYLHLVGVSRI